MNRTGNCAKEQNPEKDLTWNAKREADWQCRNLQVTRTDVCNMPRTFIQVEEKKSMAVSLK